jgi:predicted permease
MGADSNTSCPAVEGTAPGAGNVPAFPSVSGRMANLRLALRGFVAAPVFTAVAVLSLALAIGANTALFGLVDQILLRMLPVQRPQELVQLRVDGGRFGNNSGDGIRTFSHPFFLAFRERSGSVLSGLTGQRIERASLVGADRSELVDVGLVAGNFFEVLGVQPHLGRVLGRADDTAKNRSPVAVLQYDFWRTRYAGDSGIVNRTVQLNGTTFTVVGVAAPGFIGTDTAAATKLWVPVTMKPAITPTWDEFDDERSAWFYLFGRLKPGVSLAAADASLEVLYRQRQEEELAGAHFQRFPDARSRFLKQTFTLEPAARGQSFLRESFERPLVLLEWLVGLVLLIACANVANLLLARAAARRREMAIRTAIGARRGQIVRQLLVESLLLAGAGGVAGAVLSVFLSRTLVRVIAVDPSTLALETTPDLRVLAFTAAVSLVTALVFGLVPALQGSNVSPGLAMKAESGGVTGGHVRLRKALVGLQVGLATVLLVGAGLFMRTLQNLRQVDLGFRTEQVVMFGVRPATVYDAERKRAVFRSLMEGLARVPGVHAVGGATSRLLTGGRSDGTITLPGAKVAAGRQPDSYFNSVTPGYFAALGIPIRAGRDFTWDDWAAAREYCLVNQRLVDEYLDGQVPIGRQMARGREVTPDLEIVGVVGNARYDGVRGQIPRQTFVMAGGRRLAGVSQLTVYARTTGDPRQVMSALRQQVARVDPNLVVADMRTLDDQLNQRLMNERMLSLLSSGFALLATLLAVVGLYGVLAFVVARRTREVGIRIALGAGRRGIVGLVLREIAIVFAVGLGAGVVAALAGSRYVTSQLFGVAPIDPAVFAASTAALLAASMAAALLPAWRATRIDPVRALRND